MPGERDWRKEFDTVFNETTEAAKGLVSATRRNVRENEKLRERQKNLLRKQAELKQLATQDALTGLLNPQGFNMQFKKMITGLRRAGAKVPITIVMMDIDRFKQVNDTFGHLEGDRVLQALAKELGDVFKRGSDIVGRYGGEEFIAALEGTTPEEFIEYLRKRSKSDEARIGTAMTVGGEPALVTLSGGAAPFRQVSRESFETSFGRAKKQADEMLYRAKDAGRNRFLAFSPKENV